MLNHTKGLPSYAANFSRNRKLCCTFWVDLKRLFSLRDSSCILQPRMCICLLQHNVFCRTPATLPNVRKVFFWWPSVKQSGLHQHLSLQFHVSSLFNTNIHHKCQTFDGLLCCHMDFYDIQTFCSVCVICLDFLIPFIYLHYLFLMRKRVIISLKTHSD